MKKLFVIIQLMLFIIASTTIISAQVPQGIPYQAVARDGAGQPLDNQAVKVRFSILDSILAGPVVYAETHTVTTSPLGLFTANVGMGTVVSGSFSNINWAQNFKFLKVELDTTGVGNNYINLGTQQMMSVPYAFFAGTAGQSIASSNGLPSGGTEGQSLTICNGVPTWTTAGQCPPAYPGGSVFCASGPAAVVDVLNPATGKTWMDRNLGATQVATSSTDANSYGDLYQWGRRSDGHQCRTSSTTTTLSSIDQPANGNFILAPNTPRDWRSPQNVSLWQGTNGSNNPCPSGYRLPSDAELNAERLSWSLNTSAGAYASPLKWPVAGSRNNGTGTLDDVGARGRYWSSTVIGSSSRYLIFNTSSANVDSNYRSNGFSVRCLKDVPSPAGNINTFGCATATNTGTLTQGAAASGVSSSVPYTGGNGGTHNGQMVTSTGVTGLTATLAAGSFANGSGSLTYTITGTPASSGTANFALNIGGQTCTLSWTVNPPVGTVTTLSCATATNTGTLTQGAAASGVSSSVPYTGGNGGTHNGQTVTSTGVTGLTATLAAGSFANGSGSLTYTITGTPASSGTANFALSIGGQTCTLSRTVNLPVGTYPAGSVFCASGPTAVVDVLNPATGKTWMDRNLGATQVATSSGDANAYGDLYQWGRFSDGHQCRTSPSTSILSSTDQPANGNFIFNIYLPKDWRSPQNANLWQGINGINNPCPIGYRLPTEAELNAELLSWSQNNSTGAFAAPLKLPMAGYRRGQDGTFDGNNVLGFYWSSSVSSTYSRTLVFFSSNAYMNDGARANGYSVRCLKD